jgi:hypothetical protein
LVEDFCFVVEKIRVGVLKGERPMADKKTAVFAIYTTRNGAEQAADALVSAGFSAGDISVLLPENLGTREMGTEKSTKAPEGATAGASTGVVLGGALGLLAGIGALAIPGVGPLIAAGPIMAALAGMGAGGTVGGLAGALVGAGIPEFEAKRYQGVIEKGGILLSVHASTSDEVSRAKQILKGTGGEDVSSTGEASVDKANKAASGTTA